MSSFPNAMRSNYDEDEDEDVDFNPFLKETLSSSEASSSLSSEVEGLDGHVDCGETTSNAMGINSPKLVGEAQQCAVEDPQTTVSSEGGCLTEAEKIVPEKHGERKSMSVSNSETENVQENDDGMRSCADVNDGTGCDTSDVRHLRKPVIDLDDEDAICKRTRARYSLASFSLDELETFLQETDDEDDVDVDDEEEYRKFLAAVLQGGDGDDQGTRENDNADDDDDEDEDNDADFEIELEELLESDYDDDTRDRTEEKDGKGGGRRPETRQNKRRSASVQHIKRPVGPERKPLRPLVPILPNGVRVAAPFTALNGNTSIPERGPSSISCQIESSIINGFTPHQIGQLHCLIHEHVQLLIQVYSISAFDYSRESIASQVKGMILEIVQTRDQVLKWRDLSYPGFCFRPPFIHPSVQNELPSACPAVWSSESSPTFGAQVVCSSLNNGVHSSEDSSTRRSGDIGDRQIVPVQSIEGSFWTPFVSGPLRTIMDVAPLNLAREYMDDVSTVVREYRRRQIEQGSDTTIEREPMFPITTFTAYGEASRDASINNSSKACQTSQSLMNRQSPKKTYAATLVENAKKQSVASIPKEIAKLTQIFLPLFNPALFPHKPPPTSVASRVLFTDAEDQLLALGMMEYNTDWRAIQQRFLPCKSKHQIFVRQKNRSSSKAPENLIKAVKRMKASPLSAEEVQRIEKGLKVYKLDWMAVWKYLVPYRDPSLLPRQWRTALGIQKSYKVDAATREKRRLYEASRRNRRKLSDKQDNQGDVIYEENVSGEEDADNANEAYVHEGFLADWRPGISSFVAKNPYSNLGEKNLPSNKLSNNGRHIYEQPNYNGPDTQQQTSNMQLVTSVSNYIQHSYMPSHVTQGGRCVPSTTGHIHSVSDKTLTNTRSQNYWKPYRARNRHLVKLAPDLPPVTLPPTVRIISQSSFKKNHFEASCKNSDSGLVGAPTVATQSPLANMGARENDDNTQKNPEHTLLTGEKGILEDGRTDSDLHMHPLLFQPSEDGHVPYYPPFQSSSSSSTSFSFFSGNHPQLNLSLFHNPHQATRFVARLNKSLNTTASSSKSCAIDFHPLLQATEGTSNLSVGSEDVSAQPKTSINVVQPDRAQLAGGVKQSAPVEKSNELDLEIHLSSTSRRRNNKELRDMSSVKPVRSIGSAPNHEPTLEAPNAYCQPRKLTERCSVPVSDSDALNVRSNDCGRYSSEDIGDNSHPGIVMEQEELSDSDEEIEENVEFECEEMADSEGEDDLGCDRIVELQNKVSNFVTEKVSTGFGYSDQRCEVRAPVCPQGSVRVRTPSLKLGLVGEGKDATASSWLSLDSSASRSPSQAKPYHNRNTAGQREVSAAKDVDSCRATTRSPKKTTPGSRKITTERQDVNIAEQLSLGSLSFPASKKPRKGP